MRILGHGVDIIEISRIEEMLAKHEDRFLERVFTPGEQAHGAASRRRSEHLAGRFAAKEAVIKAISQIDPKRVLAMNQVEVRNDRLGRPHILLHDARSGRLQIHVSLSHVDTVAVASAIAIR